MIITRTPLRISLFGGGTDLEAFWSRERGTVIGGAINKYIYVALKHRFDGRTRACYSTTELVDDPGELKHDIIRTTLTRAHVKGVDVASFSDVPHDGSGLGSSSAFTVGLVNAIYALSDIHPPYYELAAEAAKLEIVKCHKPIGKQDHYFAAYGGVRRFQFLPDGDVHTYAFWPLAPEDLRRNLLLFYIGDGDKRGGILSEQRKNTQTNASTRKTLSRMARLAEEATRLLCRGAINDFGAMLHESWELKKTLAGGISNYTIDCWYDAARRAGAEGGKVTGTGGGGFMLFYAPKERHEKIIAALGQLRLMPFEWDYEGTKVVYERHPQ